MANVSLTDFGPQAQEIARRRKLAEMLQEQAGQPIEIQSYQGIQAPISPFAVLAKGLQAYGARKQLDAADADTKKYYDEDKSSAEALIRALSGEDNKRLGTRDIAPQTTHVAGVGGMPGGQIPIPGVQGEAPVVNQRPDNAAQIAMLLGAGEGPRSQGIANAMLPQIFGRQNIDYKHDMDRKDTEWANAQPMAVADREKIAAQSDAAQKNAMFTNQLPMTAAQRAELAESRSYHNQIAARSGGAGGGSGFAGLTPAENDALTAGIASGKIDAGRVNSRTAKLFAGIALKDPEINMVNSAGHAAMVRNAAYQRTINVAEALPTVLENVREAGKKLNYNDVAFVGKLQAFGKKQLNDPDFVDYMTQRNDALLSIANVMRGVGMSDMATKMESEASAPSMSPKAMDAWINAQQKSLAPRLEQYRKNALGNIKDQPTANTATPPPSASPRRKFNPATGKIE